MKKLFYLLIFVMGLGISVQAQCQKDFLGEWTYIVESAPYGYDEGDITFNMENDNLIVVFTNQDGETKVDQWTKKDGFYCADITVQGANVSLKFKPLSCKKIKTDLEVDGQKMTMSLKRKK